MLSKKEEVLRQLKTARKTKGLSYQDIVDGTEEIGMAVSLSTVKRVFAETSDAADFRWDTTLRPIARVILGMDSDEEPQTLEEARVEVSGLTAVVDYKDALIRKLEADLERAQSGHQRELLAHEDAEARKIAFLREEIAVARAERDAKEKLLNRYRMTAILLLALFSCSLLVVIMYLLMDRANPSWGIFWRDAATSIEAAASGVLP